MNSWKKDDGIMGHMQAGLNVKRKDISPLPLCSLNDLLPQNFHGEIIQQVIYILQDFFQLAEPIFRLVITSFLLLFCTEKHNLDTENCGVHQFNLIFDTPTQTNFFKSKGTQDSKNFLCNTEQ